MRYLALAGVCAALLLAPGTASAQECSPAVAEQVAGPSSAFAGSVTTAIGQVLCGEFAGPGSVAMAVTFNAPTCWTPQGWAVYRFSDGAWARVLFVPTWLTTPLAAVGSDLHETMRDQYPSEPRCFRSGQERWRTWHWDGTGFTASRWVAVDDLILFSAGAPISCELRDDGSDPGSWVYCWTGGYGKSKHVHMDVTGAIDTTHGQKLPQGLGGPSPKPGTTQSTRRVRCTALVSGVRCVVRATGRGFVFTRKGVRAISRG